VGQSVSGCEVSQDGGQGANLPEIPTRRIRAHGLDPIPENVVLTNVFPLLNVGSDPYRKSPVCQKHREGWFVGPPLPTLIDIHQERSPLALTPQWGIYLTYTLAGCHFITQT